jgi:hypothetical protein
MTVFFVVGTCIVAVTGIVTGAQPQSNVMTPPCVTAALSASKVQLATVPLPTTVGFEVSAGCPPDGTPALHDPGLPALGVVPQPPSVVGPALVVLPASPEARELVPLVLRLEVAPLEDRPEDAGEDFDSVGPPAPTLPHPPVSVQASPRPRPAIPSGRSDMAALLDRRT